MTITNKKKRHDLSMNDDHKERKRRKDQNTSKSNNDKHSSSHRKRRKKKKKRSSRTSSRKKHRKNHYSSESDSSNSSSSSDSYSSNDSDKKVKKKKVVNTRLLQKLAERGETLEEREERRSRIRSERITAQFGYTPEDNPFRDPNLHEPFSWKKKEESRNKHPKLSRREIQKKTISEIEKVRKRRQEREHQMEEMERIRAEESRMREQENYDEWVQKEEEFHLRQHQQRSAIRLVEGREKPIDVLAKNVLLFGLTDKESNGENAGSVKYREKYNALEEVEALEAELEEPHLFLRHLKLEELEELQGEVRAFCFLEREANPNNIQNSVLKFWEALKIVIEDEMERIRTGGDTGSYSMLSKDICNLFEGKSISTLNQMKEEIETKISKSTNIENIGEGGLLLDIDYWRNVLHHLSIFRAKLDLSDMHSKMLVRQLEKLEKRKDALSEAVANKSSSTNDPSALENDVDSKNFKQPDHTHNDNITGTNNNPSNFPSGDLEEELGLNSEILLGNNYTWQEKYRPRKPRYFNRVKTGYDWNKYNQTHYDHDNPPPKIVQGYKFNIFYPDLIDRTKTPQYFLERCADSDDFCILRFHAGPPYEDVAFKIINREWNKARKRGFRCTFERGVLSLYFNFNGHWYRR